LSINTYIISVKHFHKLKVPCQDFELIKYMSTAVTEWEVVEAMKFLLFYITTEIFTNRSAHLTKIFENNILIHDP